MINILIKFNKNKKYFRDTEISMIPSEQSNNVNIPKPSHLLFIELRKRKLIKELKINKNEEIKSRFIY